MAVPASVSDLGTTVTGWPSVYENRSVRRLYDGSACRPRGSCATYVTVLWNQRDALSVRIVTVPASSNGNCAATQRQVWHTLIRIQSDSRALFARCFGQRPGIRR